MRFRDINNVDDIKRYVKQNKKWKIIYPSTNPLEVEMVVYFHETPLLFVIVSGDIFYLSEYSDKYFITITTCWYLSSCRNKFYPYPRNNFIWLMENLKLEKGKL